MRSIFPILATAMLAVASHGATKGEIACRYDLPLASEWRPMRYIVDPIKCTFAKDSSHLEARVSDSSIRKTLPAGAFAYGSTYMCFAAISRGCVEGFMANTSVSLYDYHEWAKDSSSGRIDTSHKRPIQNYDYGPYGIFSSFGPALIENGDTISVCWIVTGDAKKFRNANNRILNCLTRADGVNSFSLRQIRAETKPPMTGIARRESAAPVLQRPDHGHDIAGRIIGERIVPFSPMFSTGAK